MQPQSPSPRWPTSAIAVTVVLALIAGLLGVVLAVRSGEVNRLEDQIVSLGADLESAEERISDLESQLAQAESPADGGLGGLGDLLGGLLGGEGGSSALDDLLGGLLGGEGGDLGDLDNLFGGLGGLGGSETNLAACLTGQPGSIEISDDNLEAQLDDISDAVTDLRELNFPAPINPILVNPDDMARRVRELTTEALVDDVVEFETRLWIALRMLEPGTDLAATYLDLLDSAVAGYYDPETEELVVATNSADTPLSATDQVTLAHELIHALTDARLGFPDSIDDPRADPEEARALQALIEGDATLGMQQFSLGALDLMDQFGMLLDPRIAASQQDLEDMPFIISNGLQLPYLEGMNFACSLFSEGGWEAVDAAYDNPPSTTVEILFPELYSAGFEAISPPQASSPGTGWTELNTVGFGAVDLLNLFSAPGDNTDAALDGVRPRLRAWGGGEATVWTRGEGTAILLNLVDSGESDTSLCDSMTDWIEAADIDQSTLRLSCTEDSVRLAIAPDLVTADAIVG